MTDKELRISALKARAAKIKTRDKTREGTGVFRKINRELRKLEN